MGRATKAETIASRLSYGVPLGVADVLLVARNIPVSALEAHLISNEPWVVTAGATLTVAGFLFAVWARVFLAGNLSSSVAIPRLIERAKKSVASL